MLYLTIIFNILKDLLKNKINIINRMSQQKILNGKSLELKFQSTISTNWTNRTRHRYIPVSSSIPTFLQTEMQRIDSVLYKKEQVQANVLAMSQSNMKYRKSLSQKIMKSQQLHDRKRKQMVSKTIKNEKRKLDYVNQVHQKKMQETSAKEKQWRVQAKKNMQQMQLFWDKQKKNTQNSFKRQRSAQPLYTDAVMKKTNFENGNITYSEIVKGKLLAKHSNIRDKVSDLVQQNRLSIHVPHSELIQKNLITNNQIFNARTDRFVNGICYRRAKSQHLLRKNKKQWEKKLQTKHKDIDFIKQRNKTAFIQNTKSKAIKMNSCRCWSRGQDNQNTTKSQMINQQQGNNETSNQLQTKPKSLSLSLMQTRQMFQERKTFITENVKKKQQLLKQQALLKDEKKLMEEKQISDAIRMRNQIRKETNNILRKSKIQSVMIS